MLNQVVQEHSLKKLRERSVPPPPPFAIGDKVILNREFPRRAKRYFPAMGPYEVTERVGKTGYNLKHMETGEVKKEVSRSHLFRFTERGMEWKPPSSTDTPTQPPTTTPTEQESVEELALERNEAQQEEASLKRKAEKAEKPKSKRAKRTLAKLQSHNQPAKKSTLRESLEEGYMVVVKQSEGARIGEIVETKEEDVTLHWYGPATERSRPRQHWKFYPGWETPDGEMKYKRSQAGGKPALCEVKKSEISLIFNRLTLQSTLPAEVLESTKSEIL